jgi:hypothetical protein
MINNIVKELKMLDKETLENLYSIAHKLNQKR